MSLRGRRASPRLHKSMQKDSENFLKPKPSSGGQHNQSQMSEDTPRTLINNVMGGLDSEVPVARQHTRVVPTPLPQSGTKRRRSSVSRLVQKATMNDMKQKSGTEETPRTLIRNVLDTRYDVTPVVATQRDKSPPRKKSAQDISLYNPNISRNESVQEENYLHDYIPPSQRDRDPSSQLGNRQMKLKLQRLNQAKFVGDNVNEDSQQVIPDSQEIEISHFDKDDSSSNNSNISISVDSFMKDYIRPSQEMQRSQSSQLGKRNIRLDPTRLQKAKFIDSIKKKERQRKEMNRTTNLETLTEFDPGPEEQDMEEDDESRSGFSLVPPSVNEVDDNAQPLPDLSVHEVTERRTMAGQREVIIDAQGRRSIANRSHLPMKQSQNASSAELSGHSVTSPGGADASRRKDSQFDRSVGQLLESGSKSIRTSDAELSPRIEPKPVRRSLNMDQGDRINEPRRSSGEHRQILRESQANDWEEDGYDKDNADLAHGERSRRLVTGQDTYEDADLAHGERSRRLVSSYDNVDLPHGEHSQRLVTVQNMYEDADLAHGGGSQKLVTGQDAYDDVELAHGERSRRLVTGQDTYGDADLAHGEHSRRRVTGQDTYDTNMTNQSRYQHGDVDYEHQESSRGNSGMSGIQHDDEMSRIDRQSSRRPRVSGRSSIVVNNTSNEMVESRHHVNSMQNEFGAEVDYMDTEVDNGEGRRLSNQSRRSNRSFRDVQYGGDDQDIMDGGEPVDTSRRRSARSSFHSVVYDQEILNDGESREFSRRRSVKSGAYNSTVSNQELLEEGEPTDSSRRLSSRAAAFNSIADNQALTDDGENVNLSRRKSVRSGASVLVVPNRNFMDGESHDSSRRLSAKSTAFNSMGDNLALMDDGESNNLSRRKSIRSAAYDSMTYDQELLDDGANHELSRRKSVRSSGYMMNDADPEEDVYLEEGTRHTSEIVGRQVAGVRPFVRTIGDISSTGVTSFSAALDRTSSSLKRRSSIAKSERPLSPVGPLREVSAATLGNASNVVRSPSFRDSVSPRRHSTRESPARNVTTDAAQESLTGSARSRRGRRSNVLIGDLEENVTRSPGASRTRTPQSLVRENSEADLATHSNAATPQSYAVTPQSSVGAGLSHAAGSMLQTSASKSAGKTVTPRSSRVATPQSRNATNRRSQFAARAGGIQAYFSPLESAKQPLENPIHVNMIDKLIGGSQKSQQVLNTHRERLQPLVNKRAKLPVQRKPRAERLKKEPRVPSAVTKSIFTQFSKCRVPRETLQRVEEISDVFWKNVVEDLSDLSSHAGRSTVTKADMELLMRRQGFLGRNQNINLLIENHLSMEYRQELIPMARAGNVVVPKE